MKENLYDRMVEHLLDEADEKKSEINGLRNQCADLQEAKDKLMDQVSSLNGKLEAEKRNLNLTQRRLRKAGMESETMDQGTGALRVITAESQAIGDYVKMNPAEMTDENIRMAERELAEKLAHELMDQNLVQFIIKQPGELVGPFGEKGPDYGTVGAKMFVIPWEETGPKCVRIARTDR